MNNILSSRSCALRSHECDREHSVKSERRSSAKGKLKLVKITFLNRHFLVKEKVVAGEKMLFLCNARKTSFITTLFLKCTTAAVPPNYARKDHLISLSVKSWNCCEM